MRTGHEFEEYHRVNGDITSCGRSDDGPQDTESDKVVESANGHAKDATDEESSVESRLPPDKIS